MLIIPAIDIFDGKAVRLTQGDFQRQTVYDTDPVNVARTFSEAGLVRIHVVDLEGSKHGRFRNFDVIQRIAALGTVEVQAGGGIRSGSDIERLLHAGVRRVVVGSAAVQSPDLVAQWIATFGSDPLIVAIDVRDGRVAHSGWLSLSDENPIHLIARIGSLGARQFLCTDINRDGMLAGPNVTLYFELCSTFTHYDIIASGGIASIDDIHLVRDTGATGVIIGKALYEGTITLDELISARDDADETNHTMP